MKKYIFIDAESDGLRGPIFAVGAVLCEITPAGEVIEAEIFYSCNPEEVYNEWVVDNVLPHCPPAGSGFPLKDFAEWWMANRDGATVWAHMLAPVKANLFERMHDMSLMGPFDGPYPFHETATLLFMADEDPTSVDAYLANRLQDVKIDGLVRNPLYDARVTAHVTAHLLTRLLGNGQGTASNAIRNIK